MKHEYFQITSSSCPYQLKRLSRSSDYNLRALVASNKNLCREIFNKLAKDKSPSVRIVLFYNPSCPKEIKESLDPDKDYQEVLVSSFTR